MATEEETTQEKTAQEIAQEAEAEARALKAEEAAIDEAQGVTHDGKKLNTFGDTVGARAFPEATDAELDDIMGTPVVVLDFVLKEFHHGDVAIMLYQIPNNPEQFTVICGGEVVRRKLNEAKEKGLLPLIGTIDYPAGQKFMDIT